MASADLKPIMTLRARRGPSGKLWLEGDRNGRRFVVFQAKDGTWSLFERINPDLAEPEPETGARSDAPPRQPSPRPLRRPLRRMKRELTSLGLIEAGDEMEGWWRRRCATAPEL